MAYVNTIGLDLRTVNPIQKIKMFLKGVVMIASYILILVYNKELFEFVKRFSNHDVSTLIVGFLGMAGGAYILLFRGFLRVNYAKVGGIPDQLNIVKYYGVGGTPVNDNRTGYEGIDRVLQYVDSESSLSTREKAAEMFISSRSIVNSLGGSDGRTLEYIDCKLSMMSRESGYQFLKTKMR